MNWIVGKKKPDSFGGKKKLMQYHGFEKTQKTFFKGFFASQKPPRIFFLKLNLNLSI